MTQTFPTLEALAVAIAADRINGGYVKHAEFGDVKGYNVLRRANKYMVMDHCLGVDKLEVTDTDRTAAKEMLTHFRGYVMLELAGKLNDFQQTVLTVISSDEISYRSQYECSIVSCLPKVYRVDQEKREIEQKKRVSTVVETDNFRGEIIVEACRYSVYYGKFRITARTENKIMDFWYRESLENGMPYSIKGKVKARRNDGTTQLNYVKIID